MKIIDELCKDCKNRNEECENWVYKKDCGIRAMKGFGRMSITKKLMNVQTGLKAPKGQYNKFGKYKYRTCEDILEALKPHLQKNNLALTITDEIITIGERFYIKATATIYDVDSGESLSTNAYAREAAEKKGMAASQETGAASTYARKYALNGLFAIDDTTDADAPTETPPPAERKETAKKPAAKDKVITMAQVKRLYAKAKKAGKTELAIKTTVKKLYGKDSAKELIASEYESICSRLDTIAQAKDLKIAHSRKIEEERAEQQGLEQTFGNKNGVFPYEEMALTAYAQYDKELMQEAIDRTS